jgi:UrcA family protein
MEIVMCRNAFISSLTWLAAVTGLATVANVVSAQEAGQTPEEIAVVAPYQVQREVVQRGTSTRAPVELVSLTRHVSYADLDLALHADVMELEQRVHDMAETACKQLSDTFPAVESESRESDMPKCVEKAVAGAMTQVDKAAAMAAKR